MNIPQGFMIVPLQATDAMVQAGVDAPLANTGNDLIDQPQDYRNVYSAMISFAPQAPKLSAPYDEHKERLAFEQFAVSRRNRHDLPFFIFVRNDDGSYCDGTAEYAWEGWKACAKARSHE